MSKKILNLGPVLLFFKNKKRRNSSLIVFSFLAVCSFLFFNAIQDNPTITSKISEAINSGYYTIDSKPLQIIWAPLNSTDNASYTKSTNTIILNSDANFASVARALITINHELTHVWYAVNESWVGQDSFLNIAAGNYTDGFKISEIMSQRQNMIELSALMRQQISAGDYAAARETFKDYLNAENTWTVLSDAVLNYYGTLSAEEFTQGFIAGNGSFNGLNMRNADLGSGPNRFVVEVVNSDGKVIETMFLEKLSDVSTPDGLARAVEQFAMNLRTMSSIAYIAPEDRAPGQLDNSGSFGFVPVANDFKTFEDQYESNQAALATDPLNAVTTNNEGQEVPVVSSPDAEAALIVDYGSYDYGFDLF